MREFGTPKEDHLTVALIDLAPELPMYNERANAYLKHITTEVKPDVLLVQGVDITKLGVIAVLKNLGQCHMSRRPTGLGFKNATVISDDLDVKQSVSMPLFSESNDPSMRPVELAPDVLIDEIWKNDRLLCVYNAESVSGPLAEVQRLFIASKISKDVYMKIVKHYRDPARKIEDSDYRSAVALLGGNLHSVYESESVQYLCGRQTRPGYYPSAFVDIWSELRVDPGLTERMEDVLDRSILLPKMVKPRRKTYFMVYNNVFGRAGSPMGIELNGLHSLDNGIPFSNNYGLTTQIYLPPLNQFIDPDANNN